MDADGLISAGLWDVILKINAMSSGGRSGDEVNFTIYELSPWNDKPGYNIVPRSADIKVVAIREVCQIRHMAACKNVGHIGYQ